MKYKKYFGLFFFLLFFTIWILIAKFHGIGGGFLHRESIPLSWFEIVKILPKTIVFFVVISFIFQLLYNEALNKDQKQKEKQLKKNEYNLKYSSPAQCRECRVCGYTCEEYPWSEDGKTPRYDLCLCCGAQFGKEDVTPESIKIYREQWLNKKKARWFKEELKPEGWDIDEQLKHVPKIGNSPVSGME